MSKVEANIFFLNIVKLKSKFNTMFKFLNLIFSRKKLGGLSFKAQEDLEFYF